MKTGTFLRRAVQCTSVRMSRVMEIIEIYLRYYEEHALQARKHEEQREKATTIVMTVAGFLVGLVTFSKLSYAALPAAISIALLGIYGFLFAGKHYERNRLHTAILQRVRCEMELMITEANHPPTSLSALRQQAEQKHNQGFKWPKWPWSEGRSSDAVSWITRSRLHFFWEAIHVGVFILGVALCFVICTTTDKDKDPPTRIAIVGWPQATSATSPASEPAAHRK